MISEQLSLEQAATAARAVSELHEAAARRRAEAVGARDRASLERHAEDLDDLADRLFTMLLRRPSIVVIRQA